MLPVDSDTQVPWQSGGAESAARGDTGEADEYGGDIGLEREVDGGKSGDHVVRGGAHGGVAAGEAGVVLHRRGRGTPSEEQRVSADAMFVHVCSQSKHLSTFAYGNPSTGRLSRLVPHRTTSKSYGP